MSGALPLAARRGKATDLVTLGRSGINVTRLAFGTGSISGKVQRDLGQEGFTRLVRHAYDSGIRFFETAESYGEMHKMLGDMIPQEHKDFVESVLDKYGVPKLPEGAETGRDLLSWNDTEARQQVEVSLERPDVKLIVNALGPPPKDVVGRSTPFSPAAPFAPVTRPKVLARSVFRPDVG